MEILRSGQMSMADVYTINSLKIPSAVLMENAAASVVRSLLKRFPDTGSACVICGCGNNGGDGFATARLLFNAGIHTDVYLACNPEMLKGDALLNLDILRNYPLNIFEISEEEIPTFENYEITIDALFGTGLKRPLQGFYEELVNSINISSEKIVAIDIPSGLNGDTPEIAGTCVKADLTVTFARPKFPHVMYPAKKMCGEVVVADISIPDFAVDTVKCDTFLLTQENLPFVGKREPDSHKGNFGHAVLIGGSKGKSGAAFMASRACARIGSGLTTLVVPGGISAAAESINPEIMTLSVGTNDFFDMSDAEKLINFLRGKKIASIGMGAGTEEQTGVFINHLINKTEIPLIIDADGINLLHSDILHKLSGRCVITPHIGEFARLNRVCVEEVLSHRLEMASCFAIKHGIIVVLKSADTIIALPNGIKFIDITGTPALSKGGSGDCLTGLITGYAAQGYELDFAAMLGSFTLGRTAEIISESINEKSILTTDIIENLWKTLDELEKNSQL